MMDDDMTFGPDDLTVADILRDPDSTRSDIEAVARYIETLESIIRKTILSRRELFDLRANALSREERDAVNVILLRLRGGS